MYRVMTFREVTQAPVRTGVLEGSRYVWEGSPPELTASWDRRLLVMSPSIGYVWKGSPPELTASCAGNDHSHGAPEKDCTCGIYAYKIAQVCLGQWGTEVTRTGSLSAGLAAVVAIDGWGKAIEHAIGYRVEHARIVALLLPDNATEEIRTMYQEIADRVGVVVAPFPKTRIHRLAARDMGFGYGYGIPLCNCWRCLVGDWAGDVMLTTGVALGLVLAVVSFLSLVIILLQRIFGV